jgi:phosphofructokinase-like protein
MSAKGKCIGILTSGGDCPGLNAAIRGVAKPAIDTFGMEVVGFLDGFTGLVENRFLPLGDRELTGLLTLGGTILGTSRNKPHKMPRHDGSTHDMTGAAIETYRRLGLDCLVCIGGGGTAKNAFHLMKEGLNVVTLPKTIDNDVAGTDLTFGYDSAMTIATNAIDCLHTTASSHQRIMLVEIMGHNAGWLALSSSLAGGADVCLIPEIPFHFQSVLDSLERRRQKGRRFSLVSVAEGAVEAAPADGKTAKPNKGKGKKKGSAKGHGEPVSSADLARRLEEEMKMETRVTSLGHVQRGGIPTATDRVLATQLGIAAARAVHEGKYGVMIGLKGQKMDQVPLEKVAGKKKTVPMNHPLIQTARMMGLCLGD